MQYKTPPSDRGMLRWDLIGLIAFAAVTVSVAIVLIFTDGSNMLGNKKPNTAATQHDASISDRSPAQDTANIKAYRNALSRTTVSSCKDGLKFYRDQLAKVGFYNLIAAREQGVPTVPERLTGRYIAWNCQVAHNKPIKLTGVDMEELRSIIYNAHTQAKNGRSLDCLDTLQGLRVPFRLATPSTQIRVMNLNEDLDPTQLNSAGFANFCLHP